MAKVQRVNVEQKRRAGRKGGRSTAQRGPEYFRALQALRETRGGGRPRSATVAAADDRDVAPDA